MSPKDEAFNISLLIIRPEAIKLMRPVRSAAMYEGSTEQFHPEGLFSTLTFGKLGDPTRKLNFSYIDIKAPVIHPTIFKALGQLKNIYTELIMGTGYAVWDTVAKDFIKTDATKGKTGFAFFMTYFDKIKYEERPSIDRTENIKLVEKFKKECMVDKIVVIPAGYRDVEYEADGRTSEDEVNGIYRKLLNISNNVLAHAVESAPELLDDIRVSLQRTFNELYDNIIERIDGKHKLLMGKVATRAVFNTTRNVLTAMDSAIDYLGGQGETEFNHSYVGLYQSMVALLPLSVLAIRSKYVSKMFTAPNRPALLTDPKTLQKVNVDVSARVANQWLTDEGIEKVIHQFGLAGAGLEGAAIEHTIHTKPLMISGHYAGLIYFGPDNTFRFVQGLDDIPEGFSKDNVRPITFTEFMYCSIYKTLNEKPLLITRYPITGIGSIYPSKLKLQSTVLFDKKTELDDMWMRPNEDNIIASCFPRGGVALYQASSVNAAKVPGLGADYDGDTISVVGLYSNNAINEANAFFNSARAYIGSDGRYMASVDNAVSTLLFHNLTRGVRR